MLSTVLSLLFLIGQSNAARDTVRLAPGKAIILQDYGGKLVELINAPSDVFLPALRPPATHWSVDIRNLGPHDVTVRSGPQFAVLLHPNESATVAAKGASTFVRLR